MKKLVPITIALTGLFVYVYFFHIRPGREVDPKVRGQGSIEIVSYDVSARISARIKTLEVEEGQGVEAGAVLATLDCSDIEARRGQAEAQVAQAEAVAKQAEAALAQSMAARRQGAASVAPVRVGAEHAERELKRAESLLASEGVPAKTVDDAEAAVDSAKKQLQAAQSGANVVARGVEVAERAVDAAKAAIETAKAAVKSIDVQLSECRLVSPAGGVVMRRNYEVGETVLPGAVVVRIGRIEEAYTWIYVANEDVGKLRIGQQVKLEADTYPGRAFEGRIVRINDEAEFTPRSIQTKDDRTKLVFGVKVSVVNGERLLLPGMPVEASVVENEPPGQPAADARPDAQKDRAASPQSK